MGYTFVRAWKTGEDTAQVEKALHNILDDVRMDGEWFEDVEETLVNRVAMFMRTMGYPEQALDENEETQKEYLYNTTQQSNLDIEALLTALKSSLSASGIEYTMHKDARTQSESLFKIQVPECEVCIEAGPYPTLRSYFITVKGNNKLLEGHDAFNVLKGYSRMVKDYPKTKEEFLSQIKEVLSVLKSFKGDS